MKNINSFSNNPLNSEKLLYMVMKNAPKQTIEGPKGSAEKQNNALKVAETMDKLSLMMDNIKDKMKHHAAKLKHYEAALGHVNRNKGSYPERTRRIIAAKVKEHKGHFLKFQVIQQRMEKVNEQLSKIETEKNGAYTKVAMETVEKINKTMDHQAQLWGFDLRKDMVKELRKRAFGELEKPRTNLACIKDLFVMMRNGETTRYKGFKISKRGNKIALEYKKVKKEFTLSVKGKNLDWEIRDAKGEKIRETKSISGSFEGLFEGVPEADLNTDNKYYYYKSESAVKNYANYKVKERINAAKQAKPEEAQRKIPTKITTFKAQPKPAPKPQPRRVVEAPKPQKSKPISKEMKTLARQSTEAAKDSQESRETITALNKWGDELGNQAVQLASNLYGRINLAKQFLTNSKEGNKMSHLTRFKNALAEAGKEIQTTKGLDKIRAVNKLKDVYAIIPKGMPKEWADKLKLDVNTPPQTVAGLTVDPSIINKTEPTKAPGAPKKAIAKAPETLKSNGKFKEWAKKTADNLILIGRSDKLRILISEQYGAEILGQFDTYREKTIKKLQNPNLSFVNAEKLSKDISTRFAKLKQVLEKKTNVKDYNKVALAHRSQIAQLANLSRPPIMDNPVTPEDKTAVKRRLAAKAKADKSIST